MSTISTDPRVSGQIDLLSSWIEAQLAYAGVPGLSIGIVYDQELLWARGFGFANPEKKTLATPSTLYRIASNSKVFTATAVLQLRDAGKLQLDDPVVKHLSWFKLRKTFTDAPAITIRHLITHTSGIPREGGDSYFADHRFPSMEEVREWMAQHDAVIPPETEWKYSNLGAGLAGAIVANVSGISWEQYVKRNILEPLEMSRTQAETPDPNDPALATGFGRRFPDGKRAPNVFSDLSGVGAAGNMTSSVEDLARFIMLQFREGPAGGRQILKGSTLREMQRVHWLHSDGWQGWGLGFRVVQQRNVSYVGHGGWVSGYRTAHNFCPQTKIGVIVLTNADDGNPDIYVDGVYRWVAPAITAAASSPLPPVPPDPNLQRYVGKFRDQWSDVEVLVAGGKLVAITPQLADPMPLLCRLTPVGEHQFRIAVDDMYGPRGEVMRFEMEGGIARSVRSAARHLKRVENW
jgi:CubicO group peptidase (beta-lactamase class C family)